MPRERIQHGKVYEVLEEDRDTPYPPSEDGKFTRLWLPGSPIPQDHILREEPSLDIHWNRDGEYVQVAIDAPRDWWERFWKSYQDADGSGAGAIAFSVFTDRLSRKEINHMIRTLRRARDAAYGADE